MTPCLDGRVFFYYNLTNSDYIRFVANFLTTPSQHPKIVNVNKPQDNPNGLQIP